MTPAEQIAANSVRSHVEFLADDRLEGRDTGSRGHEIAAQYVASRFREMGLEPGGSAGSWFQQVPLRRATTVQSSPVITLTLNGQRQTLAWARDVALRPSLTERHRAIDAPLVFVGYGLDEPPLGLDDYRGLDTKGAIVVSLAGTPRALPSEVAAHLSSAKTETAAAHGAIGLIEVGGEGRRESNVATEASRATTNWVATDGSDASALSAAVPASGSDDPAAARRAAVVVSDCWCWW